MINQFKGQYSWLSNFYPSEVDLDGRPFRTVEHAYQAAKFDDIELVLKIQAQPQAVGAKKLGNAGPVREGWDTLRLDVMKNLLDQKFHDAHLASRLIATGDEELVEGNWWGDTFWGICRGKGENHLGRLLMNLRTTLRIEAERLAEERARQAEQAQVEAGALVEFEEAEGLDKVEEM